MSSESQRTKLFDYLERKSRWTRSMLRGRIQVDNMDDVTEELRDRLLELLLRRQNHATAGWGYGQDQEAIEPTCLALLALRDFKERLDLSEIGRRERITRALEWFEHQQNPNGSWPA